MWLALQLWVSACEGLDYDGVLDRLVLTFKSLARSEGPRRRRRSLAEEVAAEVGSLSVGRLPTEGERNEVDTAATRTIFSYRMPKQDAVLELEAIVREFCRAPQLRGREEQQWEQARKMAKQIFELSDINK